MTKLKMVLVDYIYMKKVLQTFQSIMNKKFLQLLVVPWIEKKLLLH